MSDRTYEVSGITERGERNNIVPGYEGLDFFCVKERVVVSSAAVQFTLNAKWPAQSKLMGYAIKCQAAGGITTGTHIGIGVGADVDGVSETTFTSLDAVGDEEVDFAGDASAATDNLSADATISLNSLNGSGAAAGTIDSGTWDVVLWGYKLSSIKTDS